MAHADNQVQLEPAEKAAGDTTHFWRVPRYDGLECLRARFRRYSYARHTHETYAIAVILRGCETFFYRGVQHYAGAGSVAVVCPDELHDGAPYADEFEYRSFYVTANLMREIAEDLVGRPLPHPPWFRHAVFHDPDLAALLSGLHASLDTRTGAASLIEQDIRLIEFLSKLICRWADLGERPPVRRESRAVSKAREYLDAHFSEDIELADLVRLTGLSRSYFISAFRRETGLAPHAYLLDRRFRATKRLLAQGDSPADVAAACGFFDQSHLHRIFKARMGVTPGTYRAA